MFRDDKTCIELKTACSILRVKLRAVHYPLLLTYEFISSSALPQSMLKAHFVIPHAENSLRRDGWQNTPSFDAASFLRCLPSFRAYSQLSRMGHAEQFGSFLLQKTCKTPRNMSPSVWKRQGRCLVWQTGSKSKGDMGGRLSYDLIEQGRNSGILKPVSC